jgi:hypothetical protein
MLVDVGFTVDVIGVVNVAPAYHVRVPVAQVPFKTVLCPRQIMAGAADTAVGAVGVAVTTTSNIPGRLLHTPFTHDA